MVLWVKDALTGPGVLRRLRRPRSRLRWGRRRPGDLHVGGRRAHGQWEWDYPGNTP